MPFLEHLAHIHSDDVYDSEPMDPVAEFVVSVPLLDLDDVVQEGNAVLIEHEYLLPLPQEVLDQVFSLVLAQVVDQSGLEGAYLSDLPDGPEV